MLQHDNFPMHKRSIMTWFAIGEKEFEQPAQSPDLNPINHLCNEL